MNDLKQAWRVFKIACLRETGFKMVYWGSMLMEKAMSLELRRSKE